MRFMRRKVEQIVAKLKGQHFAFVYHRLSARRKMAYYQAH